MDLSTVQKLFIGAFGVLVFASVVSFILKFKVRTPNATIDNLNARINAWWFMVVALFFAFLLGKPGVVLLFAFCSFVALREFITLSYTRRGDHKVLLLAFFAVLPLQYFFVFIDWYGLYSIFIPVYSFLLLPIFSVVSSDTKRFFERAAKVQWGLMICVFCISHVPALLTLDIPGFKGQNAGLILFLVIVVQSSDVLQYVWGKLTGKHKIAPTLSPSKTVEGFVGGVASSTLLGGALYWATPFTWWQAGIIALVINLMGFFGGLVFSAIKRDRGVKDWGTLIEGHGGMLDRFDSIIFSAPIFFHIVRYFWVPDVPGVTK
jgi:phosphatidate cytidylyltransferase